MSAADQCLGRWAGVSHNVGNDMCCWIIPVSGMSIAESTVQHVIRDELQDEDIKQEVSTFNEALKVRLDNTNFVLPGMEAFHIEDIDLPSRDPAYRDKYNPDDGISYGDLNDKPPEEDDVDHDWYDKYIGTQMVLSNEANTGGNLATQPSCATVQRRVAELDGTPIGRYYKNPLSDTPQYKIEFEDGSLDRYYANAIAENLYSQVDSKGQEFMILKKICDHRKNNCVIAQCDGLTSSKNGNKTPKRTTIGWEVLVERNDSQTKWIDLKDFKESNPIELAKYAVANKIHEEPAFKWWVDFTLRKINRIVAKCATKYWKTMQKIGVCIPENIKEALELDKLNGNDYWEQVVKKEMMNVKVAYESNEKYTPQDIWTGKAPELSLYQEITCCLIFDVKMGFTRKARFVVNGTKTEAPASLTYLSVVSRASVKLAFLIAALNNLDVMSCNIGNAYLNAPCREKIWFKADMECGIDKGKVVIIVRALYGLKLSGAAWRAYFADFIENTLGFISTRVDADVYTRKSKGDDGAYYYEMMLVYVDDCLVISKAPKAIMIQIGDEFNLKAGYGPPETFLGAEVEKFQMPDGMTPWSMKSEKYVKNAVQTCKDLLAEDGRELKGGKRKHKNVLPPGYKPELDVTDECGAELISRYQQLIGILRWAIELGRCDIQLEVSLLSQYSASPRVGHLEAIYLVFHYLKENPKWCIVLDSLVNAVDEEAFNQDADWVAFYGKVKEEDPLDMPEPLGKPVTITVFVDADHASNTVTRRSMTGIVIFVNNAPIMTYSKKQNTVEAATFGSELVAMRIARDFIVALRIKLKMFGVPILGAANFYCDNAGVVKNTSIPESTLNKKHQSINYHVIREAVAAGIMRVAKENTLTNLADVLTKLQAWTRKDSLLKNILWYF